MAWVENSIEPFNVHNTPEYKSVLRFYKDGQERASRSGVLKMNHINEGLTILDNIGACEYTKRAWCLHPTIQMDNDITSYREFVLFCSPLSVLLATEYRAVANAYLCRPETDNYTLNDLPKIALPEVKHMLIADKVQNYKDFLIYHVETHQRSSQLDAYFITWLLHLGVSRQQFQYLSGLITEPTL